MVNAEYWIWLQTVFGAGSTKPIHTLEYFDTVKDFYNAGVDGWKRCRHLTSADIEKLKSVSLKSSQRVIDHCDKKGYQILTPEDELYPVNLIRIKNPPCVLYVKGDMPDFNDEAAIAVVGTRKCTNEGIALAGTLGYRLSQSGMIVVSGGALGCDIAASRGAVLAKAKSVIVMGCGLSVPYLMKNERIRRDVAENGAIISELHPLEPASKTTFPIRNRLMSALALGTLVIQAPKRSGALLTVDHALEQGKDIFAIPGGITAKEYSGNNKLLEDGVFPVYTPADIVSEYICEYPHKLNLDNAYTPLAEDEMFKSILEKLENKSQNDNKKPVTKEQKEEAKEHKEEPEKTAVDTSHLTGINEKIYNLFTSEPVNLDTIINASNEDPADVMIAVTELEMDGLLKSIPGGRYERV